MNPNTSLDGLIYIASRASVPERSARWRSFRDIDGVRIVSSWIDEAGEGETGCFTDLWSRIMAEIAQADRLVLYAEPDDFPLKGALIEAGIALGMGKPVHGMPARRRADRPHVSADRFVDCTRTGHARRQYLSRPPRSNLYASWWMK